MSGFTFDVFISYSHHDADWVRSWLLPRLEAAGLRACIDVRDFKVGGPSLDNMESAVEHSRKTLLVITPNWLQSEWAKFEALLSQVEDPSGARRRTLPLLLEPCQLPKRLGILTYADFTDSTNHDNQLRRVIEEIRESPTTKSEQPITQLTPNLVHPYAMQANFTGRVKEREELTAWLADDEHPICALIAMGGMGKSALAWHWMQHDVLPAASSAVAAVASAAAAAAVEGVMWWSFYEGESSFAKFIDEALKYTSGQPIDAALFPTPYDRAQELRKQLQHKRVLFILDGFERQLRAYARLDAAYQQDDTANLTNDERACVDPIAARLLKDLAAGSTRAKLLITTRLMVRDLEDRAVGALAGVLKQELKEMSRPDALAFMHAQGVTKGTPAEIAAACAAYGYHPLSLRLLSGLIANDTRTPGDIAAAPRHDVHADLIQSQHHVLQQSYDALPKRERTLLSRIAAFRSPMTYDALVTFNEFGFLKRLNIKKFDAALEDLLARGLLQRDMKSNRYDLHPIVRRYAYDRLTDKTGAHTRLRDYFAAIPAPDEDKVRSIEDLLPVIELYHHTARAGRYDEARKLFGDRLRDPLYYRFGAYQICIELEHSLFPDSEERPQRLKNEDAQAWTLTVLANSYSRSGQPRRAVRAFQVGNAIAEKLGEKENLAIGLGNIADDQIKLGELAAAERNLRKRIELSREIKNEAREAIGHHELGWLLVYRGASDEAAGELEIALGLFEKQSNPQALCVGWATRAFRALLMNDARAALEAAQLALGFWKKVAEERFPVELDLVRVEWLWGAALVMEGKDLRAADEHLSEALARCRRINLVDHEPDILLAWARLFRARGEMEEALKYAGEALAIADRCEYRLKQAEIHMFLAEVALEAGEREVAKKEAEVARERAWCDGPPYCYKPVLDEALGLLRELGVEV
ncbi:MAG: hypothetical protein QOF02_943 [Blastocatellia bacterium]|nr:hypothetical protein [Blastocatellia bacterium]